MYSVCAVSVHYIYTEMKQRGLMFPGAKWITHVTVERLLDSE